MKYDNCKIEIKYENRCNGEYRIFFWRICPKELNLLDRLFNNPWRTFQHKCLDELNPLYTIEQYNNDIKNITTYEQAIKYQKKEREKVNREQEKLVKQGRRWGF